MAKYIAAKAFTSNGKPYNVGDVVSAEILMVDTQVFERLIRQRFVTADSAKETQYVASKPTTPPEKEVELQEPDEASGDGEENEPEGKRSFTAPSGRKRM